MYHFIFSFLGLNGTDNTIMMLDPSDQEYIRKFSDLKKDNPTAKIMIALGGWKEGEQGAKYSNMVSTQDNRKTFIDSVVDLMTEYNLDGFDLDWEYPVQRKGRQEDKENFVLLCQELKAVFITKGWELTAAVGVSQSTVDTSYDVKPLSNILDAIHLMTYNLHSPWDGNTGLNTPYDEVENAIKYWISRGASSQKLVLGMALYGHSFTLQNENNNGMGAPSNGPGEAGPFTRQAGIMGYNEICLKENWTFFPDANGPYAFKGNQWIAFDDRNSITMKASLVKKYDLGGGMVWSIEIDDFKGFCDGIKFPLLKAINRVLDDDSGEEKQKKSKSTEETQNLFTRIFRKYWLNLSIFDFYNGVYGLLK